MAAAATQNPAVSKSAAKKKKAKAESVTPVESSKPTSNAEAAPSNNGAEEVSSGEGSYESPYIKELYKYVATSSTGDIWRPPTCSIFSSEEKSSCVP